jgi:hypothetical protein
MGDDERDDAAGAGSGDAPQCKKRIQPGRESARGRGKGGGERGGGDDARLAETVADAPRHELDAAIGKRIDRDDDRDGTGQRSELGGQLRQQRIDGAQRGGAGEGAERQADQGGVRVQPSPARTSADRSHRLGMRGEA